MPRKKSTETLEERAIKEWAEESERVAQRAASEMGRAPDTEDMGEKSRDDLWGLMDQTVDFETLHNALMTTGVPEDVAAELELVKKHPQLAALFIQPVKSEEEADVAASFALYPYRYTLLAALPGPAERKAEANRLNRRWQKTHPQPEEAPAAPSAPAPAALPMAAVPSPLPAQGQMPPSAAPPPSTPYDVQPAMPADPLALAGG